MAKPLSTFLTETTESPFTISQFPKLLARIKSGANRYGDIDDSKVTKIADYHMGQFDKLIATLNEYANKPIPNPIFNDVIKYNLSSVCEVAVSKTKELWEIFRNERDASGRAPEWQYAVDMISPYPHVLPGKLVKLKAARSKYKDNPNAVKYFDYMIAAITEILPLINRFLSIKNTPNRVFKRQPKPIEDRQAKYVAPLMEFEAGKKIVAVLTKITDDLKGKYSDQLYTTWLHHVAQRCRRVERGNPRRAAQKANVSVASWHLPHLAAG
jgi:hypothetical protein